MAKQKIVPHLWFDKEAVEAAEFYTKIFPGSKVTHKSVIKDTPSGDCDIVSFQIMSFDFMAISAGPYFKINPSISFFVNFDPSYNKDARRDIESIWEKLSKDGKILMPIGEYSWSKRYGWVQDKYGGSWQLILTDPEGEDRPKIVPSLLFVGDMYCKAEEAVKFYVATFKNAKIGNIMHYGPGQEPNKEGTVMFSDFKLDDSWIAAMDGGGDHKFKFNEAISFIINCKDQEEIDYYWKKLSAVPESEQCGWVKDKFGISWQIIPKNMGELISKNPEKITPVMLKMKKIIIKDLKKAGENEQQKGRTGIRS